MKMKSFFSYLALIPIVLFSVSAFGVDYTSSKFTDAQKVQDEIGLNSKARVIVVLDESTLNTAIDWSDQALAQIFRTTVKTLQNSVLSTLTSAEYTPRYRYENFAAFSGSVTESGLDKLVANPSVLYIQPVVEVYRASAQGLPLMNAIASRSEYDGSGVAIAIVDDAVDYTHPNLGGGAFPNNKVIGGYDFGNNDPDPAPVLAGDLQAHGTCVAGVAAGATTVLDGDYIGGGAPGAKIYALKFSDDIDGGLVNAGGIASWDWCITHQYDDPDNPILIINNSWGGGFPTNDERIADFFRPGEALAAARCVQAGMVVVAASGNDGFKNGISSPAANSNTIAVGAVADAAGVRDTGTGQIIDAAGTVMPYSNSGVLLDVLAPADCTYTTDIVGADGYQDDDWMACFNGTSCATPYTCGMIAVMQQASRARIGRYLTPDEVLEYLTKTGVPTTDVDNGITRPLIDLGAAITAIEDDGVALTPNPMKWDVEPVAVGLETIYMQAVIAEGVTAQAEIEYYFECLNDSGFSSGWQDSTVYYRGGYDEGTTYQFRVKARDKKSPRIENEFSAVVQTTTASGTDNLHPAISPAEWDGAPRRLSSSRIGMAAAAGFDEATLINGVWQSAPVEFFYDCVSTSDPAFPDADSLDSGWVSDPAYVISGLTGGAPGNSYVFRTRIRDAAGNLSEWSEEVTVLLSPPPVVREVPNAYPTIQRAIDAANHGDTVLVHPGVYSGQWNINFSGFIAKYNGILDPADVKLTVRSEDPENASIVATTVIDCFDPEIEKKHEPRRAFEFVNGEGRGIVLAGLTIQNALAIDDYDVLSDDLPPAADPAALNALGGAIMCGVIEYSNFPRYTLHTPASPTIRNCVFINCAARGLYGPNGGDSTVPNEKAGEDMPGLDGGPGGHGGHAAGGVMFAVAGSAPLFKECTMINCSAVGGEGGDGGDGQDGGDGSDGMPGQNGGNGGFGGNSGSAWGGTLYFEPNCLPELYDVVIENSLAKAGKPGNGGNAGDGGNAGNEGGPGGNGGNGGDTGDLANNELFGGAIYFGTNTQATIVDCEIRSARTEFIADETFQAGHGGNGGDGDIGGNGGAGGGSYLLGIGGVVGGGTNVGGNGGDGGAGDLGGGAGGNGGAGLGLGGAGTPAGLDNTTLGFRGRMHTLDPSGGGNYYRAGCVVTMLQSTIADCVSFTGNGGGEYYGGGCSGTYENSVFENNSTHIRPPGLDTLWGGEGGAIMAFAPDRFEFTQCRLLNNEAKSGGGIYFKAYLDDSALILTDCTLSENKAIASYQESFGGGVYAGLAIVADAFVDGEIASPVFDLTVDNCTFTDNISPYGGGLCVEGMNVTLKDTHFEGNRGEYGAGFLASGTDTSIQNCTFYHNLSEPHQNFSEPDDAPINTYCSGGGLYTINSVLNVMDTVFAGNEAEGFAGAAMTNGPAPDWSMQRFVNCLFVENSAGLEGGAMGAIIESEVELVNNTFVDNTVAEPRIGAGGGLLCHGAFVDIFNTIFWGNLAVLGPQISVGEPVELIQDYDPFYIPYSTVFVDYSDVEGGKEDIFVGDGSGPWLWYRANNIEEDPIFASVSAPDAPEDRTFYLSQVKAGQLDNSPCLDAGFGAADDLAMELGFDVTTRTDHVADSNSVDIGYHYNDKSSNAHGKKYILTLKVDRGSPTPNDTVLRGYLDTGLNQFDVETFEGSDDLTPYEVKVLVDAGSQVALEAILRDSFYTLKQWHNTDNDNSTEFTNSVRVTSNTTVILEVETTIPTLRVFVREADGTLTQVTEGDGRATPAGNTLWPEGAVVNLQAFPPAAEQFVRWEETDDDTILGSFNTVTMDATKDVILEFYTPTIYDVTGDFTELQYAMDNAEEGDVIILHPGVYDPVQSNFILADKDIVIQSYNPDDPDAVANTVIRNCGFVIEGTTRKMILNGITISSANYLGGRGRDNSGPTGDGENGEPMSGGGLEFEGNASATIKNCVFEGCSVVGGNGGNGAGDGGWGGFAHGGAVSVGPGGDPRFINCQFIDNFVRGGGGGDAGSAGVRGGSWEDPLDPWLDWDFGPYDFYWKYSGYGGAIYCDKESAPEFRNCYFSGNVALGGHTGRGGLPGGWYKIDRYGGAVYAAEDSHPVFVQCIFEDNQADVIGPEETYTHTPPNATTQEDPYFGYGGAIASEDGAVVTLKDCVFEGGLAHHGGSIYTEYAVLDVADSNFLENTASFGGALYCVDSEVTVDSTQFVANVADLPASQGGAVFVFDSDSLFTDVIFDRNSSGRSGGAFFTTGGNTTIKNGLVINNTAVRDGGGISSNWYSDVDIENCTFSVNEVAGTSSGVGQGGAIFAGYQSYVDIINSILWDNSAKEGQQLALSTGFQFDPVPSRVKISYSDVQGNRDASAVFVDAGCILDWDDASIIYEKPLFIDPSTDNYHLSQPNAGDPLATMSPCVDAGSDLASNLGFDKYTTTYPIPTFDGGRVDIGYHYSFVEDTAYCAWSDLANAALGYQYDGVVAIGDLVILAHHWLENDCDQAGRWCHGSDLNFNGGVDFYDFILMAKCWGVFDYKSPLPDSAQWAVAPKPMDSTTDSIYMEAVQATDDWRKYEDENGTKYYYVEYYFKNQSVPDGSHDSGWRQAFDPERPGYWYDENDPSIRPWIFIDEGLPSDRSYTYTVRVRDVAGNTTADATPASAIAGIDGNPPIPNPSQWAVDGEPMQIGLDTVAMEAAQATDQEGNGVEYLFVCVEDNTFSSGWRQNIEPTDPGYVTTPWVYEVSGLTIGETYTFYVKTRDRSLAHNESDSSSLEPVTIGAVDVYPPIPNPAEHASGSPAQNFTGGIYYHVITAVLAEDVINIDGDTDPLNVEYRFINVTNSQFSSGGSSDPDGLVWRNADNVADLLYPNGDAQVPQQYWVPRGIINAADGWYILVRDRSLNQNTTTKSQTRTIFTPAP